MTERAGLLARAVSQMERLRVRLDRARSRVPVLDAAVDVVEQDADIGGGILAGALAYRLFLFMLPLGFLFVAILGLGARITGSTPRTVGRDLGFVGIVTHEVAATADNSSSVWVAATAVVVVGYATTVLYRAVRVVHALAWEHSAGSARTGRRSLRLFALGLATQVALSSAVSLAHASSFPLTVLETLATIAALGASWLGISLVMPHGRSGWIDLLPGALLYGVGLLAIHIFNVYLLDFIHRSRSNTYGTLGAAAAILLSLFFIGRLIVGTAVLNATLFERRHRDHPPAVTG